MRSRSILSFVSAAALIVSGCGGGGSSTSPVVTPPPPPPTPSTVYQPPAQEALTVADVQQIIAQSVTEAQARNRPATIAVVDRVGNLLALFTMNNADLTLRIPNVTTPIGATLPGLTLGAPAALPGAVSKAVTAAYLSSSGNAFSTRTASQIVQEHFPPSPNAVGLESGPLFGVQFSSLPCSDLVSRFVPGGGAGALIGPKRTPLGLSADPGGLALYKNGVVVGGIGVMADGVYGFDSNILDVDNDDEEYIALAGTRSFEAPTAIRADRISVDGTLLRYSDATPDKLRATGAAPAFSAINGVAGALSALTGYSSGAIIAGTPYGSEASGIRASTASEFSNRDAFILSDGSGNNRFPIRAGTDGAAVSQPLSAAEARAILEEAFLIMSRARAQIRQPLDSRAQVSISVVDTFGAILGVVRSPDAPIFGIDVSLQKARAAAFFSNANAASELSANGSAAVRNRAPVAQAFFNSANIFKGQTAWSARAIGNIARPYFPDGEVGRPQGPLSVPIGSFNPFNTGLQSELVFDNLVSHVTYLLTGGGSADTPARCTLSPDVVPGQNRLQNGIQIFPGAVPIYRGSTLIGAVGVSGDGIDQDDMIAFLGANNAGTKSGGIGNAPSAVRSDQLVVQIAGAGVRLRYVGCPFTPFLDTSEQNVCQGR
ncbi:MAG: heme-binding protein [Sphingomonadales bacterium]|nr:heme-binding protein [Sphingomonadales bacterium]